MAFYLDRNLLHNDCYADWEIQIPIALENSKNKKGPM